MKKVNNDLGSGWEDASGNVWVWDPIKEEWDVQHPDGGEHTNIAPDGSRTHQDDRFPNDRNLKTEESRFVSSGFSFDLLPWLGAAAAGLAGAAIYYLSGGLSTPLTGGA